MKKIKSESNITVEFYDLDPMNVVWHGNYVKYLEKARCDLLEKIGYTYDDMRQDGVMYPVATVELKFVKSAFFKQKLIAEAVLEEYQPAMVIKYRILDAETKEVLCKAKTMQICVNINTGESVYSAPENFVKKLDGIEE